VEVVMYKKFVSIFTIFAITVLTFSCYNKRTVIFHEPLSKKYAKKKIFSLVTKSGDTIVFTKKMAGRLSGGTIKGIRIDRTGARKLYSIPLAKVSMVTIKKMNWALTIVLGILGWFGSIWLRIGLAGSDIM
jgi:hypothetical protein